MEANSNNPYLLYRFGDYYGLGNEGISRSHIKSRKFLRLVSDDTEHLVLTLDALNRTTDPIDFTLHLKRNLRTWLITLPPGIGLATLKACALMWVTSHSGRFSAGNGPLMRVLPIVDKIPSHKRLPYLEASTKLTHTDPKAMTAVNALNLLLESLYSNTLQDVSFLNSYLLLSAEVQWHKYVNALKAGFENNVSLESLLQSINCGTGISGYCYHTILAVTAITLYGIHHGYTAAQFFEETLKAGGDTDSTCALIGAIVGIKFPNHRVPYESIDYPLTSTLLQQVVTGGSLPKLYFFTYFIRNILSYPFILGYALIRRLI